MSKTISLISELVTIDHGKYIVRVSANQEGIVLGTGLAAADNIEVAEDRARERALGIVNSPVLSMPTTSISQSSSTREETVEEKSPTIFSTNHRDKSTPKSDSDLTTTAESELKLPFDSASTREREKINQPDFPLNLSNFASAEHQQREKQPTLPIEFPSETATIETQQEMVSQPEQLKAKSEPEGQKPEEDVNSPNILNFPSSNSVEEDETDDSELSSYDLAETMDFAQIINETTIEMKRLNWTQEQGRTYLLETYGKKSRHLLSDEELIEFLNYLKAQ